MSVQDIFGEEPSDAEVSWLNRERDEQPPDPLPFAAPDSWTPRNLAEIDDVPPVQPTLGGLGLAYPGKRHVFSGPQESAKTLAAYVVCLAVVRSGAKVVLIDFEMGPWDAKTRLRELGATKEELASVLYVEPETGATSEAVAGLLAQEPALVVVDAAAGAFALEGLDDNARKDVERWAQAWVQPFWRAGVATIVLDHVTKNAETRGNYAIGSERKVGQADVHIGFTVVRPISRGDHGLYRVTTHKDRGGCLKRGHLCDFKLTSDPLTHDLEWEFVAPQVVDEEHPFRPTIKMEQTSRWLEKQAEPVPMGEVEDGVGGKRDAFRESIRILIKEGYVRESKGKHGARLMELIRVYREATDNLAPTSPHLAPEPANATSPLAPSAYRHGRGRGEDETSPPSSPKPPGDDDPEPAF